MKYTFSVIEPGVLNISASKDFPFMLLTGASLNHQGTFSRHTKALMSVAPECLVEVSRNDARAMGINNGDVVIIESARSKIKLKAKVSGKVSEGMVFISEDYEWQPVNLLKDGAYTPVRIHKEIG